MGFVGSRATLLPLVLMLALALGGLRAPLAVAQDDEQRFAELLAQRGNTASLAGPLAGELIQEEGFSTVIAAGVETAEFSATAAFENPTESGELSWDFGFVFHLAADGAQQMVIDSDGLWYYSPYPSDTPASGLAPMVDNAPGATNTVDLVVEGDVAYLGINGEFVTSFALPPGVASDIQVGTGFFSNTTEPGRIVSFVDFEVWPLSSEPASVIEIEGAPAPDIVPVTVTPTEVAAPVPEPETDAEAFALLLELQSAATPIAGPFTANLKEEENRVAQSWAAVDLVAFHARATFDVPEMVSDIPWDIGFTFGASPAGPLKIAVDSLGNWYYSIGDQGPANQGTVGGVVTTSGGSNTIDLIVADQRAVFGLNGAFVAKLDLPVDATAGDVAAGASYYSDQTLPDRVMSFREFVILPFDPDAPVPTGAQEAAFSSADLEEFASYLSDTQSIAPAAGPFAGRLVEATPGAVPQAAAGIVLADFGAVASFINPDDVDAAFWDAGIQFRSAGDATHRLVLRSNGDVSAVQPDGSTALVGAATAYDPSPGAFNEIQLVVRGGRALVGVNGELAAAFDLPSAPIASDILVGTAFFGEDFVQDRVTGYEGFSVWELA